MILKRLISMVLALILVSTMALPSFAMDYAEIEHTSSRRNVKFGWWMLREIP